MVCLSSRRLTLLSPPLTEPYLRFSRIRLFKQSWCSFSRAPLPCCFTFHCLWPLVPSMFPLLSLTACWPLRSTHFHGFLHYYEPVRLLTCLLLPSSLLCAQGRIPSSEHVRSPGYSHCTLHARHALRPRRNLSNHKSKLHRSVYNYYE